jgi:glucokinase
MSGPASELVPVLEIGGSHVTAAVVDLGGGQVQRQQRLPLDSSGSAEEIIDTLVRAAERVESSARHWGIAIPGPFDYVTGVGGFEDVGKFDQLSGVDLGAALRGRLGPGSRTYFVNDAEAFGVGESVFGAGRGHARTVCLTLGTGIGSAFVANGMTVTSGPDVPPLGYAYRLSWEGRPIEDAVSARALRRRFAGSGGTALDVHDIAGLARSGDPAAQRAFEDSFLALGGCLGPWVARFRATMLIVGGSIAESFDLIEEPLSAGLRRASPELRAVVCLAGGPDTSALLGAALATPAGRDAREPTTYGRRPLSGRRR